MKANASDVSCCSSSLASCHPHSARLSCISFVYQSQLNCGFIREGFNKTYHVCVNQLARPQHIDPESQKRDQLPPRFVGEFMLEHAFVSVHPCEHGEEQRVQVTGHSLPVLGAAHLHIRVVWVDLASTRIALHLYEFGGFPDITSRIIAVEDLANVIGRNAVFGIFGVVFGKELQYVLNLMCC